MNESSPYTDWEQHAINRLTAKYGTVPPPWALLPDHPYSPVWRTERGIALLNLWKKWWHEQHWWQAQQFQYLQRFEPSAAWLEWVIFALWPAAEEGYAQLDPADQGAQHEYLRSYFHRLRALNFGSYEQWLQAIEGYSRDSD